MKRARPLVFGVVVFGLVLWMWSYFRQGAVGSVRQLPDGSSVEVVAVTFGAQHKVVVGRTWEKLLLHLAPKNFVTIKKFPWIEYKRLTKSRAAVPTQQILYRSETANSLVFWTILRKPNDPVSPNMRALAADELGNEYETARMRVLVQGANYSVVAWEFTAFPRRGRKVTLRLYDTGAYQTNRMFLTEFTAPNPDRGPHAVWTPEPLPQTNHDANLTVVLTNLVLERLSAGFAPSGLIGRIRPTFRIYENGQPSDAWQNEGMTLSDATGNSWNATTGYHIQGGVTTPEIQGTFGVNESAWRLKPLFVRIKDFPEDELWTVRNVPVAGSPPILQTNPSVQFKGFTLTLQNGGAMRPVPFRESIVVSVSPQREDLRVTLVKAEDHQGRTVRPHGRGHLQDYRQFYWDLNIRSDATAIDFTFAIQAARSAEFLAKPTIIAESPGQQPVSGAGAGLR